MTIPFDEPRPTPGDSSTREQTSAVAPADRREDQAS